MIWLCFSFNTLIFFNLSFMATREFLCCLVISGLLTWQALLVLHLCRFQQPQYLYYWHHHHHHTFVIIIIWSHFILITKVFSKIYGNKKLNRGGSYGMEISVKYCLYGQEKIVQWLNKKLETVKKELQCKISKSLK